MRNALSIPHLFLTISLCLQFTACGQVEEAPASDEKTADPGTVIDTDAPEKASPLLSRAPYVQLTTSESIFIIWRTSEKIDPVVKFGSDVNALGHDPAAIETRQTTADNAEDKNPLHSALTGTFQYEAKITGLAPDTEYFYAIYDGTKRLTPEDESYHFQTHPEIGSDRDVYFWAVGDSGTGGDMQAQVHDAMIEHNKKNGRDLDLYVHVGDMAYGSGTNKEFSDRFFTMYDPTLRNVTCWAAMGNHEGKTSSGKSGIGPFYDGYICPTEGESGGLASGNESYYSFDYGKVHFIALNSHDLDRSPSGAMAKWLKADLEETNAEWVVCFFHHPPYTKGSHDSDKEQQLIEIRQHIMPILEAGGCDLTLTGHSHIYERSMLIDGAYDTPTTADGVVLDDGDGNPKGDGAYQKTTGLNPNNGSVNIVTGHGGTNVRRKGTMPIMRSIIVENGSTLVHIKDNTMHVEMLNYKGEIRDVFAITKSDDVPLERPAIENPWQPAPASAPQKTAKKTGSKVPKNHLTVVKKGETWSYLAGSHPEGNWTSADFDASSWKTGKAGFGYSDNDDATELPDMKGNYKVIYIRHEFEVGDDTIPAGTKPSDIGLAISYDDGFIAYLNGKEVARVGVDKGRGKNAKGFHPHEANNQFQFFPFRGKDGMLKPGKNVIAIEGHNANLDSTDLTLHPSLIIKKK